jgi:hypothetical protein
LDSIRHAHMTTLCIMANISKGANASLTTTPPVRRAQRWSRRRAHLQFGRVAQESQDPAAVVLELRLEDGHRHVGMADVQIDQRR